MKRILLATGAIVLMSSLAMAEDLVPATTDDVSNFDSQVANSARPPTNDDSSKDQGKSADHRKDKKDKKDKSNFGMIVSAEAKKLKDSDQDKRKGMGKWVSNQRRQDDKKRPDAAVNPGSGASGNGSTNSDAHTSAPAGNTSGNGAGNSSGHGQSGNHGH